MKGLVNHLLIFACYLGLLISVVPIVCFLIGILIYRGCVWVLLRRRHGTAFRGFLQLHDALWAVEEENSLSVIHTLVMCENKSKLSVDSGADLFVTLWEKLSQWKEQSNLEKIFLQKKTKGGYNYLVRPEEIKLEEYLKLADVPSHGEFLTSEDLQNWISSQYQKKLPGDHSNLLEILVSRKGCLDPTGKILHPVLIRIHHSLADGVALLKLFTSSTENREAKQKTYQHSDKEEIAVEVSPKNLHSTSTPVLETLQKLLKGFFVSLPRMILYRHRHDAQPDFNSIHNDKVSSQNFVNWYFESDGEELLEKIKTIKAVESGITFQDVICASLSVALNRHFNNSDDGAAGEKFIVPAAITIGNAVQLKETRKITNNCAYNFEKIPVRGSLLSRDELNNFLKEIRRGRGEVAEFQNVNYCLIKICSLLPERFLYKLVTKDRCSLGLSNIPGPSSEMQISGSYSVNHLTFWTPNRFKCRLGVSVFSLGNRLHVGIGGDEVSFRNGNNVDVQKVSKRLLDDFVNEIHQMYEIVTKF